MSLKSGSLKIFLFLASARTPFCF